MMANLKYWLKGLAVAALSMVVYAGALGCYIALMLLVISMEEGGDNLSAFSVSLTEAVVLLSQGNGFKTGSITLTIMPLLLTVLLIALIASLAKRVGTSLSGCVAGTIGWVLINVFFANSLDIKLVDTTGVVAVKTAIVFVLGYAIAAIPESPLTKRDLDWISEHVSSPVRKTVTIGVALGVLLITVSPRKPCMGNACRRTRRSLPVWPPRTEYSWSLRDSPIRTYGSRPRVSLTSASFWGPERSGS